MSSFFFDTYALIEVIKNNPNYLKMQEVEIVTTQLNLMELHYYLLRTFEKETAKVYFKKFSQYEMEIEDSIIFEANIFRYLNKKKKFSYTDCIGYILALRNRVKFLTGDIAFKGMENVEFVR